MSFLPLIHRRPTYIQSKMEIMIGKSHLICHYLLPLSSLLLSLRACGDDIPMNFHFHLLCRYWQSFDIVVVPHQRIWLIFIIGSYFYIKSNQINNRTKSFFNIQHVQYVSFHLLHASISLPSSVLDFYDEDEMDMIPKFVMYHQDKVHDMMWWIHCFFFYYLFFLSLDRCHFITVLFTTK